LQSEHFPFLGVNNVQAPMINMHCRTTFYTALGRLLMVELGEDEEQFERFMMPLRGISLIIEWSRQKSILVHGSLTCGMLYG